MKNRWTRLIAGTVAVATCANALSSSSTLLRLATRLAWARPTNLRSNTNHNSRPSCWKLDMSTSSSSTPSNQTSLSSTAAGSSSSSSSSSAADSVPNGATPSVHDDSFEKLPLYMVLWKFSRPHTIIGSALAIPSLHLLAAPSLPAAMSMVNVQTIVGAMIPACLMNLYITGLNQITDVEIDKVNKPYLPIAAGMLSMKDAVVTVVLSLLLSLAMGLAVGTQGLHVALWGSAILGTIYSLEPFRLKRFPALAAFCIVAVRGAIINASFFTHAKAAAFGQAGASVLHCLATDRACALSSLFFGIFGFVIALMKDVPDVVGDRLANIKTFSVRIGQKQVFTGMRRLLSVCFWGVSASFVRQAVRAPTAGLVACRVVTSAAAAWAGWSVRQQAQSVNPEDSDEVYTYYMHLWKLFYMSYLFLPFAR